MSEAKTYAGGCHCGQVKYEVTLELTQAMQCNCSICSKRGWLLAFASADQFRLLAGEPADYQFGKKHVHHTFCATCGVASFSTGTARDGRPMYAINLRCLEGLDLAPIPVKQVDGRSL